ncbi:hypothetical protein EW146_g7917 [Bondarzewia mesenterica]|uniref:Uncharacterized protein n=1 Tax=Bondarzewia mesenterica TaxID=1095465 RepID=A0A4S4LKB0_9AGAM|nr:hypothetical protein EW146_g7917 [Bondarzewia mesenterica]
MTLIPSLALTRLLAKSVRFSGTQLPSTCLRAYLGTTLSSSETSDHRSHQKSMLSGHGFAIQSLAFNPMGQLLAMMCRDRKLHLFDPRAGEEAVRTVEAYGGIKGARVVWMGDRDRIATTGFNRMSDWQVSIWETGGLTNIKMTMLDQSFSIRCPTIELGLDDLLIDSTDSPGAWSSGGFSSNNDSRYNLGDLPHHDLDVEIKPSFSSDTYDYISAYPQAGLVQSQATQQENTPPDRGAVKAWIQHLVDVNVNPAITEY